jgi:methionyl-tRNA formyltransferase
MRIAFAGTPAVAAKVLEGLANSQHEIVLVLSRPDSPKGRGKQLHQSEVKSLAESLNIPVLTPSTLKDPKLYEELKKFSVDVCIVVAYGVLIPSDLLRVFKHGWLNLHYSLLPRWRGAAPVQRSILAGDDETGVTIFRIEEGLDTGPILRSASLKISATDNSETLINQLNEIGLKEIKSLLDSLEIEPSAGLEQLEVGVTHAAKITQDEARINWSESATEIDRRIRAMFPNPKAWTEIEGMRIKISSCKLADTHLNSPGSIYIIDQKVVVATGKGSIELHDVQPAGKPLMKAADWLRGLRLTSETKFK